MSANSSQSNDKNAPAYTPPAVSFNAPFAPQKSKQRKITLYVTLYFFAVLVGLVTLQSQTNKEVNQRIKEFEELAQTPAGGEGAAETVDVWLGSTFSLDDDGNVQQTSVPTTRTVIESSELGNFVAINPSPDTKKLCLVKEESKDSYVVYTANSNGTNLKMIAEGEHCSWSPDSTMLAFNSLKNEDGSIDIFVHDGDSITQIEYELRDDQPRTRQLGAPYWLSNEIIANSYLELVNSIPRTKAYSQYNLATGRGEDFTSFVDGNVSLYRTTEDETVLYLQSNSAYAVVNKMRIYTSRGYDTGWITFSDFYTVPRSEIYYAQFQDINGNLSAIHFDSTSKRHLAPQTGEE